MTADEEEAGKVPPVCAAAASLIALIKRQHLIGVEEPLLQVEEVG